MTCVMYNLTDAIDVASFSYFSIPFQTFAHSVSVGDRLSVVFSVVEDICEVAPDQMGFIFILLYTEAIAGLT